MNTNRTLGGVVVPLVTPLDERERVDVESLARCVEFVVAGGVHGVFVNSTTGEYLALTDAQREINVRTVAEVLQGRAALYVGVSDIATGRVLENVERALRYRPDALVVLPPLFYPARSDAEMVRFFETVADRAGVPIILYNNPFMIRNSISVEAVSALVEHPQIAGIKDSSADFKNMLRLIELKTKRPDFRVFVSKGYMWLAGMLSGAGGMIDALLNVIPEKGRRLWDLLQQERISEARVLQQHLLRWMSLLDLGAAPAVLKAILARRGLCRPHVTHPLSALDARQRQLVEECLIKLEASAESS